MPVYEIEAPNGKILEIEGDTPPTEQELDEIFQSTNTNTEQPQRLSGGVGIDVTPSGLLKNTANIATSAITAPLYALKNKTSLKEGFEESKRVGEEFEKQHPAPIRDFLTDTAGYGALSFIPGLAPVGVAKNAGLAAKAGNFLLNSARLGAIPGIAEGLKNRGAEGIIGGGLAGTGTAATIQAGINSLPYIGKIAGPVVRAIPGVGNFLAKSVGRIKPKTLEQATKPTSKALDLTEEEAQRLLMNTTERVRNDYNDLLSKKGANVGNLLEELPEDVTFKAQGLTNGYDSILNNYSLSKNADLNPAINATKKELGKINELIYGEPQKRIGQFKTEMENLKYPKENLETTKHRYKNQFYTKSLDTINNDIIVANRRFNDEVLNTLKENPDIINNPERIATLEQKISNFKVPEDYMAEMYLKFYEALEKGDILNVAKTKINPKELYDINKNISNMIDWDKPGAELKNAALEQIYMANANKISGLSKQLKQANKEYSDLMDFQKNEGIRRILRSGDNIDTASSALKNYNSTVTKGNTGRNIQELEKILVDNGYQPFLNEIDDVNAAMDLLNARTTGDSGLANIAVNLTRPVLKGIRKAKGRKIPEKIKALAESLNGVGRIVKPALIRGSLPILYGGAEYQE